MDEMKIRSKFMRGMISKIASKVISKKIGIKPDIDIKEIELRNIDGKINIHLNIDASIKENDLLKITRLAKMEDDEWSSLLFIFAWITTPYMKNGHIFKEEFVMILTFILLLIALLLLGFIIGVTCIGGTVLIIIFSDVIVCLFIIIMFIKFLNKRRRK